MNPKFSVFIFFLTLSFNMVGQQLPMGTFVLSTGFTYTEFNFKNKSKFHYKYSGCTGGQEGRGTYTFKNGELLLTFDNPKGKQIPPTQTIIKDSSKNDTTYLSFLFYDSKDATKIEGVRLEYKDKLNGNNYGTISNEQGKAKLKFHNNQLPIEIKINYIGIESEIISFDSSGIYTITYPLNFNFIKQLVKGQTLRFIINDFDDEELVLKPVNEKEFRTFRRKEE